MPKERLSMRKIREILKLKYERERSGRSIARSISVSPSTVTDCLLRAKVAGIRWPEDEGLDDGTLELRRSPKRTRLRLV